MANVFARDAEKFACRSCGATRAPRTEHVPFPNVCEYCWHAFRNSIPRGGSMDENLFNRWLARQVFLSIRRLKIYGVTGRCEAVSRGNGWLYHHEHQCAGWATQKRDGRHVCGQHARASAPLYIDGKDLDPYDHLEQTLAELAILDEEFRNRIISAVEKSRGRWPEKQAAE